MCSAWGTSCTCVYLVIRPECWWPGSHVEDDKKPYNVEEKLLALHRRLTLHGKRCWRIFCWYIFHAVQRISKQILKWHSTTKNDWDHFETQLIKDPQELKAHLLHTFFGNNYSNLKRFGKEFSTTAEQFYHLQWKWDTLFTGSHRQRLLFRNTSSPWY